MALVRQGARRPKVKITDLTVTIFSRELPEIISGPHNPVVKGKSNLGIVTIHTDEGVTGYGMVGGSSKPPEYDVHSMLVSLKPLLIGQDPLDREAIYNKMLWRARHTTWRCIGAIDVALWDLAGKIAGLPIYKLLGAARNKVPAYASSPGIAEPEGYVEQVFEVKERGFKGYKIHPPRVGWQKDVLACQAVRKAIGDEYMLMLDSSWMYDFTEAMRVGRAIEDLNFYWFEDPLAEDDIYNYTKLGQKLDIPLMATEHSPGSFHSYAAWIEARATHYLRGDVAAKGGITDCIKSAHLAEAFRMNYEMHHGGNSINNIANLHVMCAIRNSEFFEVHLSHHPCGVVNEIDIDSDGMITVPDGPGLGINLDKDYIKANTVAELS